jgi:hypothetical protein
VSDTVGGPTLHTIRRRATNVVPPPYLHCSAADTTFRPRLENISRRVTPSRSPFEAGRVLRQSSKEPARFIDDLKRKLPSSIWMILLFVGSIGWCWPVLNELRSAVLVSPAEASIHPHTPRCQRLNRCRGKTVSEIGKLDPFRGSNYAPSANPHVTGASLGRENPARIVAPELSGMRTRVVARGPTASVKHAVSEPKPNLKMPVRLASLERAARPMEAIPSRIPSKVSPLTGLGHQKSAGIVAHEWSALTSLVHFETAPFPYHGAMPGSGRPFLNADTEGHWGHVNFRGEVLWESQTFSDDRVLLHIPPGFDPKRPAVMVVFFHGHGANLAQDVRDRQHVPA